jgi:hypothetical protein
LIRGIKTPDFSEFLKLSGKLACQISNFLPEFNIKQLIKMETNQNNNEQKSNFKTNVLPFLIIVGVLVASTVVLYFVVQMIVN